MSPSPRRLGDLKSKKQTSFDTNISTGATTSAAVQSNSTTETESTKTNELNGHNANGATTTDGKFENISDNGSEISDEGYRSLGLIQQANNNQSKRASLHSQTSIEDVKTDDAKSNGEYR